MRRTSEQPMGSDESVRISEQERHNLCTSPVVSRRIRSRKVRLVENIVVSRAVRNTYKSSVRKHKRKETLDIKGTAV